MYSPKTLTTQLKEAETLLASTIYQAKQKLENISRAAPVSSEELIKYSHKISASSAVCAPLNWQQVKVLYCPDHDNLISDCNVTRVTRGAHTPPISRCGAGSWRGRSSRCPSSWRA